MIKKWLFVAGAGIGYVLGSRAGREKYDRLAAQARQILDNPKVKEATDAVQIEATRLYDEGKQVVRERMRKVGHRNGHELADGSFGVTDPDAAARYSSPLAASTTPTTKDSATIPDYPSTG